MSPHHLSTSAASFPVQSPSQSTHPSHMAPRFLLFLSLSFSITRLMDSQKRESLISSQRKQMLSTDRDCNCRRGTPTHTHTHSGYTHIIQTHTLNSHLTTQPYQYTLEYTVLAKQNSDMNSQSHLQHLYHPLSPMQC